MKYPKFLKFGNDNVLVKVSLGDESPASYYRHGGEYNIKVTLINGRFFSGNHSVDHISNQQMYPSTLDEWDESNGQYATPEYMQVHNCKMQRIDWDTYECKNGRIKAKVGFKNRTWVVIKCGISNLLGRKLKPITEELFLK